jgi:Bacterial archaeo-eukaryotic release factor family 5
MKQDERDRLLKRLLAWRPPSGILSVYVDLDPADRSRGWRIALRDRLKVLHEQTAPHEHRRAFEAAAARVLERFPEDGPSPNGRGHAGFIEVAEKPDEMWRDMQVAPRCVEVVHLQRPYLRPLVELFAEGPHVGVVLASADRIRLLDWSLGALRELDVWEITLWSRDWRERKAERSRPGQGERTSASGRDQFNQRLEANRQRFLREAGERVGAELAKRGWQWVILFGPKPHSEQVAEALQSAEERLHISGQDLISAPEHEIAVHVETEVREVNRTRERALIREMGEAIGKSAGVALGPREALDALSEGRVRHLVFDADRDYAGRPFDTQVADGTTGEQDGLPVVERMIELALATGAEITPVHGDLASELSDHDGAVGLLRY